MATLLVHAHDCYSPLDSNWLRGHHTACNADFVSCQTAEYQIGAQGSRKSDHPRVVGGKFVGLVSRSSGRIIKLKHGWTIFLVAFVHRHSP